MRLFLILLFGATVGFASEYNLNPAKINDSLYCFFGKNETPSKENKGNMVNSCYIDGGDSLIVVDTGPSYLYAKEAYEIMTKKTKKEVKAVVNTHFHDDHLGGNQFFLEKHIPIYGNKAILEAYEKIPDRFDRMKNILDASTYNKTKVVIPTEIVDANHTIKTAKGDITIFKPVPKSHTIADMVVWMPSKRIMIAGDLVHTGMIIPIRDGDINGWIKAIEMLQEMKPQTLIGGHGNSTDANGLVFMHDYLLALRNGVKNAMNNGVELADIVKKVDMSKYDNLPYNKETGSKNIISVFQQFELEE